MYYLYKIKNTINTKLYFGVTGNPAKRWEQHISKRSNCVKLKRAMQKYGVDKFSMEVVCIGSMEYILDLEGKVIETYDTIESGYNTLPGGLRSSLKLPDSVKDKISSSLNKFYQNNKSPILGRTIEKRSDDCPVFVSGFWFPNKRTALLKMGISVKTFFLRV